MRHASMPGLLNVRVIQRIRDIKQRFQELAPRVCDGRYKPRRPVKRSRAQSPRQIVPTHFDRAGRHRLR